MTPKSILGAAGAAAVGALAWGGLSALTGYEIGYLAWGIGLIVGGAAAMLGGQGTASGVLCALLSLASIFLGKMLAIEFAGPAEIRKLVAAEIKREYYDELAKDSADFAELKDEEAYAGFMASHGFTEAASADAVTEEELDYFKANQVPRLVAFHRDQPDYETWKASETDRAVDSVMENLPVAETAAENLNVIDIIFALLGIGTAYKLGAGSA